MIDIEDDVPLPDDGWTSNPADVLKTVAKQAFPEREVDEAAFAKAKAYCASPGPGPNDCTFIGGPLNGKFGPLRDNDKRVLEIEIYNADGSVASVELYALGDMHPTPTFRYHVGTK